VHVTPRRPAQGRKRRACPGAFRPLCIGRFGPLVFTRRPHPVTEWHDVRWPRPGRPLPVKEAPYARVLDRLVRPSHRLPASGPHPRGGRRHGGHASPAGLGSRRHPVRSRARPCADALRPRIVSRLPAARALEHIRVLSEDIGPRIGGTASERVAADYIAGVLDGYGFDARLQHFPVADKFLGQLVGVGRSLPDDLCWQVGSSPNGSLGVTVSGQDRPGRLRHDQRAADRPGPGRRRGGCRRPGLAAGGPGPPAAGTGLQPERRRRARWHADPGRRRRAGAEAPAARGARRRAVDARGLYYRPP